MASTYLSLQYLGNSTPFRRMPTQSLHAEMLDEKNRRGNRKECNLNCNSHLWHYQDGGTIAGDEIVIENVPGGEGKADEIEEGNEKGDRPPNENEDDEP